MAVLSLGHAASVQSGVRLDPLRVTLLALCAVVFTAGSNALNQYADVENDRVNKPHRPIPSGRISHRAALRFSIALLATAVALAIVGVRQSRFSWSGLPLLILLCALCLTVLYSCEPFRLRRWGIVSNAIIAIGRGGLLSLFGWTAGGTMRGPDVWVIAAAFTAYIAGAATIKDMSDEPGDRVAGCRSLVVLYGARRAMLISAPFMFAGWLALGIGGVLGLLRANRIAVAVLAGSLLALTASMLLWGLGGTRAESVDVSRGAGEDAEPTARKVERSDYNMSAYAHLRGSIPSQRIHENHPAWFLSYIVLIIGFVGTAVCYALR